jgi:hypothetical protein
VTELRYRINLKIKKNMSPITGPSQPSETTSLLNGDSKKATEPTLVRDGDPNAVSEDGADREAGSAQDAGEENPLFEGNKEMRKRLIWLLPALSIGVSYSFPFSSRNTTNNKNTDTLECSRSDSRSEHIWENRK